jgi:hypothetical protein
VSVSKRFAEKPESGPDPFANHEREAATQRELRSGPDTFAQSLWVGSLCFSRASAFPTRPHDDDFSNERTTIRAPRGSPR